jgi:hypothetical protein
MGGALLLYQHYITCIYIYVYVHSVDYMYIYILYATPCWACWAVQDFVENRLRTWSYVCFKNKPYIHGLITIFHSKIAICVFFPFSKAVKCGLSSRTPVMQSTSSYKKPPRREFDGSYVLGDPKNPWYVLGDPKKSHGNHFRAPHGSPRHWSRPRRPRRCTPTCVKGLRWKPGYCRASYYLGHCGLLWPKIRETYQPNVSSGIFGLQQTLSMSSGCVQWFVAFSKWIFFTSRWYW